MTTRSSKTSVWAQRCHREEVLTAAKLANCEEFAEKLPDKWNTNIGENGCALSGGERQRISIARAFLKDAPIILLDEATASLDVENETAIQEALSRLIKKNTGQSFSELLLDLRLKKSMELLRLTDMRINDIAAKAGYNDVSLFHLYF